MAKKKGLGASFRQQVEKVPVVQQKAPRTISTNVSTNTSNTGGGLGASFKTATQKAEEERSARMRQGISSVVRASFKRQMSQPTRVNKSALKPLATNALAPVKNASTGFKTSVRQKALPKAKEVAEYTRKQQNKYVYTPNNDYRFDANGNMLTKKDPISIEYGNKLRAGMPSTNTALMSWRSDPTQREREYRDKYGYTQKVKEGLDRRLNDNLMEAYYSPTTGEIKESENGRAFSAGHTDAWARENVEDTIRRQYGIEPDEETLAKIEAQRGTVNYGAGNMLGQTEQYLLTRGLLGAAGLVGAATKAAPNSMKALRALGKETLIDQAASVPLNMIDAMKADNFDDMVKRFGLNQALDLVFSFGTEGFAFLKNPNASIKGAVSDMRKAFDLHKAAKNAPDEATKNALNKQARNIFKGIPDEKLDEVRKVVEARIGNQRPISDLGDERIEAIQNAEGTVGEFPSTDYAYRIGGDKANYDNMRDDMLGAIESQEGIGAGEVPNDIGMRAEAKPYESTAVPKTGVEKVLSDYGMSADELIDTIENPYFDDLQMLDNIADDLFPVGRKRSMAIDAERAYSNNLSAFEEDPALFDGYRPTREEAYTDVLTDNIVNELRRGQTTSVADDVARAVPAEQPAREAMQETARATERSAKVPKKKEQKTKALNSVTDEEIDRLVREQTKEMYDKMSTEELNAELRRLKKNPTVTPDVEGAEEMGIKEAMDSDEVAQRTDVINEILNERRANGSVKQQRKAKANAESEAAEKEAKRIEAYNLYKQVDKEFKDAIRKRSYKGNTLRAYPRAGDMRILYMDNAYDENGFRRLIREDIERANAQKQKAEPKADRSKVLWDDIKDVTKTNNEPEDLMKKKPNRKENTIPKPSEQAVKKEVFNRGEGIGNASAKETAEQTAQEAQKRRQVRGVLGNEKPKAEEPKTRFSEMNDHELQNERYRYEEQSRFDPNGTSLNRITEIDEEFARRGKEPKWTKVEPEQGGKRVLSEEEIQRLKKEQGEKHGTWDNSTPKAKDTADGVKRVSKTYDREIEKATAEVQHEFGNRLFAEDKYVRDGKTVKEFVAEVTNKYNKEPEVYSRRLLDKDIEMDARERQIGLFISKGKWGETVESLERRLQKADLDDAVRRDLEDQLKTATELETRTTEKYLQIVPDAASILKIHGILNKLTKHTKGEYIDETIRKMEKRFRKRLDKFGIEHLTVSDELREELKNAKEPIEVSEAWAKITAELYNQVPASFKEKADFFRVNAMLFNLPTHVRNFFGNVLFAPMREMKNLQAAGLENIAQKLHLIEQSDRRKAVIPSQTAKVRAKFLRSEYGDVIRNGFKYLDEVASGRPHGQKMFMAGRQNGKGLAFFNGIRRAMDFLGNANLKALSAEDKVMFSSAFDTAYAREFAARKLTLQDVISNPELEQELIEHAADEALRATFNDVSAFTRVLSRWANPGENANIVRKGAGLVINAIQPFINVPVNILRRGVDYSPGGWGKGLYHIGKGWHDHDAKLITKGIDQLASGTTGSAVALTGWLLAKHDRINAQIGNEDDESFMKNLGKQKFSLVFKKDGDKEFSYSIDWAEPGAIPLFLGVTLERLYEEGVENVNLWEIADLFESVFEPVEELSVLQGAKNTAETFQGEDNWVRGGVAVAMNTALQYAGQFLPTSIKRTARQIDPIRRDISSQAEVSTQRTWEKWLNKQKAGIPSTPLTDNALYNISSTSLPAYKNAWGEEQRNTYSEDWKGRVLENFVSPGYVKEYNPDDVDQFLLDMYEKDKSARYIFPERNWKGTISYKGNNVHLTKEELDDYDKTAGKEAKAEIRRQKKAGAFDGIPLNEQQKLLRDIYADANLKATQKILLKQGHSPWEVYSDSLSDSQKNYKDIKKAGVKPEKYYELARTKEHDLNNNNYTSKAEWVMYLNAQDFTDAQRAALYPLRATGNNPYLDGTAYTTDWKAENEKNLSKSAKATATKFENAEEREEGGLATKLFDKSVIQRADEMREKAGGSSSKSSSGKSSGGKRGRSGRRSGGGGGSSKARAKTESEKKFASLQKMQAPTTGKGIEALSKSAKGLTKAQKKALIKLMQKKLDV